MHAHTFNGPFSGTTQVSHYQKCKTNLDFTEETDSEWQWHQLGHMQVCTSIQLYAHASSQNHTTEQQKISVSPTFTPKNSYSGGMNRHFQA